MPRGYEPLHIAGILKTAYGLATPRCLDWRHGPHRTSPGTNLYRRSRGGLALLALACLAGCTAAEHDNSPSGTAAWPSGTVTPRAGTATPGQERLGAVMWPADGTSAADVSGYGVVDGPAATRPVPIASVAKLMRPRAARLRAFFRAAGCALGEG
jgi:hypothetical protein